MLFFRGACRYNCREFASDSGMFLFRRNVYKVVGGEVSMDPSEHMVRLMLNLLLEEEKVLIIVEICQGAHGFG